MINIELNVIDDPLRQKIESIKLYRLSSLIKSDIENYFSDYLKYNDNIKFQFLKEGLSKILDKHGIDYIIEYIYDKNFDNIKILIGKNFVLNINFIRDSEYHI